MVSAHISLQSYYCNNTLEQKHTRAKSCRNHCSHGCKGKTSRHMVNVCEILFTALLKSQFSCPLGKLHVLWVAKSCTTGPRGRRATSRLASFMEIVKAILPLEASHFNCRLAHPFEDLKEDLEEPLQFSIGLGIMTSLAAALPPSGSSNEGETVCRSSLFSLPASTVQMKRCMFVIALET